MGEGEDKGGRGQPSEDFSKHQHMPWEVRECHRICP